MKKLSDIALNITEEEYRADSALSYSTLAKFERENFNNIEHLFDKIETPSLTFGSAVDSIITGGQEEFDERFMVAEFPSIPDSIIRIVKDLFKEFSASYRSLSNIPDIEIMKRTETFSYQLNWKPDTRVKVIRDKGSEYYSLLYIAGDRTIINTSIYQDVCNAVRVLKESEATKFYFAENNPFEPEIERFYQLKFKANLEGIDYRNMADLIVVLHKDKRVIPVDLKTSSHTEWDFYKSFIDWRYDIQSRLYWRIIRDNMDKDNYFKDFKLDDYKFIVVNRKTLTPLVWDCPFTQSLGTLTFGKNNQIELRDPFEIGKELHYYLTSRPKVPMGINETGSNDLNVWLNKL